MLRVSSAKLIRTD